MSIFSLKFPFYLRFCLVLSIFLANVCPGLPYYFVFLSLAGLLKPYWKSEKGHISVGDQQSYRLQVFEILY